MSKVPIEDNELKCLCLIKYPGNVYISHWAGPASKGPRYPRQSHGAIGWKRFIDHGRGQGGRRHNDSIVLFLTRGRKAFYLKLSKKQACVSIEASC